MKLYMISETESTEIKEIPLGAVSEQVRFVFDYPFTLPAGSMLALDNGEWFQLMYDKSGRVDVPHSGHWKVRRSS